MRYEFIKGWIENGKPKIFWINKFIFPQAFITGTKQNFARKYQIAIDTLAYKFIIFDNFTLDMINEAKEGPDDGCYIYGMQMEGARWDYDRHFISPSQPKVLYTNFPMMQILPYEMQAGEGHGSGEYKPIPGIYKCPTYKVLSRWGQLSTTGHSTNFVMYVEVPIAEGQQEEQWTLAGVALFLALKY